MALLLALAIWFSLWPGGSGKPVETIPLDGLWLSDGYGFLVELDERGLHTYEMTSISCIPSRSAKRFASEGSDSGITFTSGRETTRIIRTDDPNVLRMHTDGTTSDIVLRRISRRPDSCQSMSPNTPQENYAVFWKTFAEQYPFFSLHKVDWRAVDKKFRPEITAATKPVELFQIFRKMIEPLQDSHTGLEAGDLKAEFDGWRDDPSHLEEDDWKKAASIIESRYVREG